MSHREMELEDGHESLSHSRRSAFRRCRRYYWLQYEQGLFPRQLPAPLRMGSIYSDGLEMADPMVVRTAYESLVADAKDSGDYYHADQLLDELAVVEPMVETYLAHVALPLIEREVEFTGSTAHNFQDNGRWDGIGTPTHEGDKLMVVENKLKGRFGAAEEKALAADDQITSYILNACKKYDMDADGVFVRYEVAKKPGLRQGKTENREQFRLRVANDIRTRPTYYHWVSPPITRSQDLLDEWEVLFSRMARDITYERHREEDGDPSAWPKNPDSCHQYGACQFIGICWAKDTESALLEVEKKFTRPGDTSGS